MKKFLAAFFVSALCWLAPAMAFNLSIAVQPTVQLAAYASGNSLGGLQTIPVFQQNGQYQGTLYGVSIANANAATATVTVYLFDTLPTATTCTDKAAFVLGAADVPKLAVAPFTLTPAAPTGTTRTFAQLAMIASVLNKDSAPRTPNLYACLIVGGAVTPVSTTDYTLKIQGDL